MSVASQGKSNAATAESEMQLVDTLFDLGNFWDDQTGKDVDAEAVDEESTTLKTDLSQNTLKTIGNPLDQLLDLVGACLGVEDASFNYTSDDAVCADLAPCLPDTRRITNQRATKDRMFIDFLVSGGFKPTSGKGANNIELESPQKAVSRSVGELDTDEVKDEPLQAESLSPDNADEVGVSTCVGSSERVEGIEVEYPGSFVVEDPESLEESASRVKLAKLTVWNDEDEVEEKIVQSVEVPPVSENVVKDIVWNDEESFEEAHDAENTSPSPGVKVVSLSELASSTWVFQPLEKSKVSSGPEIQPKVEEMLSEAPELKEAATSDTAPHDERAFSASVQGEEQEMIEREVATSKTTTRTEAIRSFISKKAAGAEACKAAKAETRKAKLEKRQVLKKEKARRREAAKAASKTVATTLLGGSLPLKLGRIEKKNSKAEASPKSAPTTTKTKAAPVQPGAVVATNPVVKTVLVEHSPRDIVERTVTFEDDQVSVIERQEGRDTQETTMISTVAAAAAVAASAPDNKVPPVDPPAGRPKMRIFPPNAWIKQSSGSSSMASWLGSHLSTEEPELSTLEQKGSWLEEYQQQMQQKQQQQQQQNHPESIE